MSTEPIALRVHYMESRDRGEDHSISVGRVDDPTDDEGVDWEFMIEWHTLGGKPAVRIDAFDDAWLAFAQIPAFFQWLAASHGEAPGLSITAANLAMVATGGIRFTGHWPESSGVQGDKRPEPPPHPPEHAPAYARVARWNAHGSPVDPEWAKGKGADVSGPGWSTPLRGDYLRAGLPGWEG
jgi:hypothetical protein